MKSELYKTKASMRRDELSWVNQITQMVDRSPLPGPLCYVIGGLVGIALFTLNDWLALGQPSMAADPFHLVLALGPAYTLGLMHFLDVRGRAGALAHASTTQIPRSVPGVAPAVDSASGARHAARLA